jgi:hypothetical protein
MKTRDDPSRLGRKPMGSCHRNPGFELVIAGFRMRLSRRPLRRGIIFRFCDISRVCGQVNFPSISAPHWPRASTGRLSATRLRSSRTSSGRRPHDRVGARIFRGSMIFQGFAGRKISHRFSYPAFAESRAGRPSATRLRSSRKWRVREAAVAVEFRARARSHAPSPSRNARPFGIAAWNRPQRNPQAVDRNGPARVGANEESRGARSRNAAPIAEERSCKIA